MTLSLNKNMSYLIAVLQFLSVQAWTVVIVIQAKISINILLGGYFQESGRQEMTIKLNLVVNRCFEFITVSDRVLFLNFF
jgi:hypothetical protein